MKNTGRFQHVVSLLCVLVVSVVASGDGPADNIPTNVRPVPPVGIEVPAAVRDELLGRCAKLRQAVEDSENPSDRSKADVLVFARAVELAVEQRMFYSEKELDQAKEVLAEGERRLQRLGDRMRGGRGSGRAENGDGKPRLVVGGFRSKIDNSIQPYGLVIPANWQPFSRRPMRLDIWLHGRGERTSEAAFLYQRMNQAGEFTPPDTFVLHPYGRYCNAFKFAGEIDVLEALEHVQGIYPIDGNRISIRGFSMGGAGCWQMAVHYPNLWYAANPGAGFSETLEFLKFFQKEDFVPTAFQKRLLHWYDCPDWANNLRHLPTVAYSGEIDSQKQAADIMEAAMAKRGMKLLHLIGPDTGHKIHADSKLEIERNLSDWAKSGREVVPLKIDLTTYTLRYNSRGWLSLLGLGEHWKEARVEAELASPDKIVLKSTNVTHMQLAFQPKQWPFAKADAVLIRVDDQELTAPAIDGTLPWAVKLARTGQRWKIEEATGTNDRRVAFTKRPGLQGPIDDAFMDSFLFVRPSKKCANPQVEQWVQAEYSHAKQEWRRQFRGDIQERDDNSISGEDYTSKNLVLFGDPTSNRVIARIAKRLPIQWSDTEIRVGDRSYPAANHALVMVYPNPLNPNRYVVINSGFTYREFAYLNNARQIPMLPDWAIVDITEAANFQLPGKIAAADFFDEQWQVK